MHKPISPADIAQKMMRLKRLPRSWAAARMTGIDDPQRRNSYSSLVPR